MGIPRIGLLFAAAPPAVASRITAFRDGLGALGYVEGKQLDLDIRYAWGDLSRMPLLAAQLVRLPVQVIVSGGSSATRPALAATSTIPIVMAQDNDPVGSRVVQSLARPGGNVTGLSTLVPELSGKQLALLSEMVPGLRRIVVFEDSGEPGNPQSVAEARRAAARLNIEAQILDARNFNSVARMFAEAVQGRPGAALVLASAYMFARQDELIARALQARLPVLYAHPEFVRRGGFATYGVNVIDLFRDAAGYVVRILNGAKPADLPIAQPRRFELVINLQTARALGIAVPTSLLIRADEVIQ
jgi:putative ABC transport system substrate-binding protein